MQWPAPDLKIEAFYNNFKDLSGQVLKEIEQLRESVVAPLVAIVREHTAQSSPQSAPAESQETMDAQSQGAVAGFGMMQEALQGVPMSLAALLQMAGAGGKLQHASQCRPVRQQGYFSWPVPGQRCTAALAPSLTGSAAWC